MSIVSCKECHHTISTSAAWCQYCGAPISVANPPPEPPADPAPSRLPAKVAVGGGAFILIALSVFGKPKGGVPLDHLLHGPTLIPEAHDLADGAIPIPTCRHDWRSCVDNLDWSRNGDWAGARNACTVFTHDASGHGHLAFDAAWSGPRFDRHMDGASIREGYVVLVDRGGLVRDASGGWNRADLHCTFEVFSGRASSVKGH